MILGLLSDTHDNAASTLAALQMLSPHAPAAYLHAGDMVDAEMLEHFRGLPLHFVFGNNEWDHAELRTKARALDLVCHDHFAELEFAGRKIALLHGHDAGLMARALQSKKYDYLVHGHTHVRRDERVGRTRVINPGAVHRARPRTVAILDVSSDKLISLEVPA